MYSCATPKAAVMHNGIPRQESVILQATANRPRRHYLIAKRRHLVIDMRRRKFRTIASVTIPEA